MADVTARLSTALADRYRIERHLGEGGMANVYLAEDLKHDRKVAVKVLRPELAAVLGAERFVQEIKTTASLQHPHILPLFDSGEADSFLFYVMPYVEGETLRDKLNRETQFGVDEAVGIASDVADALDYAHRHNVIHRDIKPENILLHDGRPMVADFGIALAVSAAAGGRMTETGLSLGTPHYMSPEQATAEKELTARSDVYSLGCVLYEMLTGNPPHVGATAQQIIMKIVTEEADPVTKTRKAVPPNVTAAVGKSLEKLPADRFESAAAFAAALADQAFTHAGGLATARTAAVATAQAGPWNRLSKALAGVAVVTTVLAGWALLRSGFEPGVTRFLMTLPEDAELANAGGFFAAPFAVSPDGKDIVYSGTSPEGGPLQLYVRSLDRLDPVPVPGTDSARAPFLSPDGLWVGFHVENRLRKVPLAGGPATTLAEDVIGGFSGASWGDDGYIVYTANRAQLHRVNAAGGEAEVLLPEEYGGAAYWPHVLPGGNGILFTECPDRQCDPERVAVLDRRTGEITVLVEDAARGWYAPTGHLIYAREDGAIFAVAFDPGALELTGSPMPLFDGVAMGRRGSARLAFSHAGTMAFLSGFGEEGVRLGILSPGGLAEPLAAPSRVYYEPRFSPDGNRIAATVSTSQETQVWIYDRGAGTLTQLTFEGTNTRPAWSPDGSLVSFNSNRTGAWELFVVPTDRSAPPEPLSATPLEAPGAMPHTWTRDGAWVVFDMQVEGARRNILGLDMRGDRTPQTLVDQPSRLRNAAVSPDGQWLAYVSNESGNDEVYVRPFPGLGGRWQISTSGGRFPMWMSHSELVFMEMGTEMMEVATLEFGAGVQVEARQELFDLTPYRAGTGAIAHFDLSRDSQRFLLMLDSDVSVRLEPVVVLNWFEEIKQRQAEQGGG